jgi:hypothetical protein
MSHRPSKAQADLSAALERAVRSLELGDAILFDAVSLPRSPSSGAPAARRSGAEKRLKTSIHASATRPLPSLPEDEDTRVLRAQVGDLEHESTDLDVQLQLAEKAVAELRGQLEALSARADAPAPSPRRGSAARPARPETPDGLTPPERALFWKQQHDAMKAKLDGLTRVLELGARPPARAALKGKPQPRPA